MQIYVYGLRKTNMTTFLLQNFGLATWGCNVSFNKSLSNVFSFELFVRFLRVAKLLFIPILIGETGKVRIVIFLIAGDLFSQK